MGKTGRWLTSFLVGKKEKDKDKEKSTAQVSSNSTEIPATPISTLPNTPKEKRRWSFRRSSATAPPSKDLNSLEQNGQRTPVVQDNLDSEDEQKDHARAAVIRLTAVATGRAVSVEEAAAIKIQSVFRAYLARKALHALKGLVKLQALVRGHLVRKQATATLRCMQALLTVQAKVRAQRLRMAEEAKPPVNQKQMLHRKSTQENQFRHTYHAPYPIHDTDGGIEENIKIVEMDPGELKGSPNRRNSYSNHQQTEKTEHRFSTYYAYPKQDNCQVSPALTDLSPRASSSHFEDYFFSTAKGSPQHDSAVSKSDLFTFPPPHPDYTEPMSYEYSFFPNYMANTESSRAKVRSHSAPKQRPESYERPPSRRRASMEGRNIPRAMRMQRSSSHVGATAQNYHYPWNIKLDRSSVSLKDSECGSTSTVLTNTNYCRFLTTCEAQNKRS